jgi:hypothetical protein
MEFQMKKLLVLLACAIFLFGCGSTKFSRSDFARRAKVELVGKSKKEILMCAGVPVRSQQVDNMEFMTYLSGGDSHGYVAGGTGTSVGGGAFSSKRRYCEVTFILKDGVVEKVSYSGRTGGWASEGEQCAFVLQNCLEK